MKKNTAISCRNISKEYTLGKKYGSLRDTLSHLFTRKERATFMALDDVSFDIEKGSTVGLIGPNGAGKSTLLKILSRITAPTQGRAIINGRLSSLLEVGTGFHHELSGRENIYLNGSLLGMTRAEIKHKEAEIIDFSGVEKYIDTPVKHYSSGMYVRLAFAVAAQLDSDILLIDEVLAVGDQAFQKKSLKKLDNLTTKEGKTVILVSHNSAIIDRFCSSRLILNNGRLVEDITQQSSNLNEKLYSQGPIRRARIYQNDNQICLEINYETSHNLLIPNLGIECRDKMGGYVFSYNPLMEGSKYLHKEYPNTGTAILKFSSPILQDGQYSFSLFFGDGRRDYFKDIDALQLEILSMGSFQNEAAIILPQADFTVS